MTLKAESQVRSEKAGELHCLYLIIAPNSPISLRFSGCETREGLLHPIYAATSSKNYLDRYLYLDIINGSSVGRRTAE